MISIYQKLCISMYLIFQQMRMDWNELKWIQIFRNIGSMLKWMLFNSENAFLFIYRNCMEHISMSFNLNNINFFCAQLWILFNSKFWIGNAVFQSNCIQLNLIESNWILLNPIKSKKKYSLFKIRIRIEKNFNLF